MPALPPFSRDARELPSRFGRYELTRLLGTGGVGKVYEADLLGPAGFRRRVALKMLHSQAVRDVRELAREARLGGLMSHPNLVDTYDLGEHEQTVFVAMELVRGPTLSALIRHGGALPARALRELLIQLCGGLAHLHELVVGGQVGLVHRDLKPANVLLTPEGRVKIADFGISSLAVRSESDGSGTPGYMAPEQAAGDPTGPAADLFALGVMGWEAATGRRLAKGRTPYAKMIAVARLPELATTAEFLDPVDAVLPGLGAVLGRCLAREPSDRWQSARELGQAVAALEAAPGDPLSAVVHARGLGGSQAPTRAPRSLTGGGSGTGVRPRTNLGSEPDRFFGREDVLAAIDERFEQGAWLVALRGPGGAGKTRTSQRYGRQVAHRLRGGVWFVDLQYAATEEDVVRCTAEALGLPASDAERLGAVIAGMDPLLLILDNAEQVVKQVATMVRFLRIGAASVRVLVTTRERLKVRGEKVIDVGELGPDTSMALFRERSGTLAWASDPEEVAAVEELIRRLDGMPLALELAAARTRVMAPSAMVKRLGARLALLRGGQRGAPTRQTSIYAAIEGSWEVCSPAEQATLAQCAVFAGGFSLDDAQAVVDLSAVEGAPWVVDTVQGLLERSLMVAVAGENPRFRLYESIRDFGLTQLERTGARAEAEVRHAAWFARRGDPALLDTLIGSGGPELQMQLMTEHSQLLAASRRMVAADRLDLAVPLVRVSARVARFNGPFREALELVDTVRSQLEPTSWEAGELAYQACDLGTRLGELDAVDAAADAVGVAAEATGNVELRFLEQMARGFAQLHRGQPTKATKRFEAALPLAELLGSPQHRLGIALRLGAAHGMGGKLDEAEQWTHRCVELAREVGDGRSEANALVNLGSLARARGRHADAAAHLEGALDVLRVTRDLTATAIASANLGAVYEELGRLEEARRTYERAIRLHGAQGARRSQALTRTNLAQTLRVLGDHDAARAHVEKGAAVLDEIGAWMALAYCLIEWALLEPDPAEAQARIAEAQAAAEKTAHPRFMAMVEVTRARLWVRDGEPDLALDAIGPALATLTDANELGEELQARCVFVQALWGAGEHGRAREELATLRELGEETWHPQSELGVQLSRTRALVEERLSPGS